MTNVKPVGGPKQQLTLFDSTCIIVGIIIGAGIYRTSPQIAANCTGPARWLYQRAYLYFSGSSVAPEVPLDVIGLPSLVLIWTLGGLIALVGALCYAELTTTYPKEGGDYVFLTKAYGRRMGFLFVWMEFWIIRPGSIGSVAYVFALYANELMPLKMISPADRLIFWASASVIVLTATNLLGVKTGKWTQNLLTATKVAGLLAIFATTVFLLAPAASSQSSKAVGLQLGFPFALIMIMYTYGGWNDMSYVAAEVKDRQKNLLRALVLGTVAVAAVYLLVNIAFVRGLGYEGLAGSDAVAADLLKLRFGDAGGRAISLLICISCLGAMNGMLFTGARIFYALGVDHRTFGWLGKWNQRFDGPGRSVVLAGAVTLLLVVGLGVIRTGKEGETASSDAFERLVLLSSPFFWLFLFLVGLSLLVLRRKDSATPRSYCVIFFPVTPILFCSSALFMLHASTTYAYLQLGPSVLIMAAVVVVAGLAISYVPARGESQSAS